GGLLEPGAVMRQALRQGHLKEAQLAVMKRARIRIARLLLHEAGELARDRLDAEEAIDGIEEVAPLRPAHDPLNGALLRQREAYSDVRIEMMGIGIGPRVYDRVAGLSGIDVLQRVRGARCRLHPSEVGSEDGLHPREQLLLGTACPHGELGALELQRLARLSLVAVVDHE